METTDFLTGYETRVYKGYKKTPADLIKDKKMVAGAYTHVLSTEIDKQLEDGTIVSLPILVDLVVEQIKYWKKNPSKIDMRTLALVLGELKQEVVVETESASDVFKGVVAGAITSDTDSKPSE